MCVCASSQISLIYANVTEEDILLREEMNFKHRIHGDKFKVFYTLDKPPAGKCHRTLPKLLSCRGSCYRLLVVLMFEVPTAVHSECSTLIRCAFVRESRLALH